jgi:hypothetical protein
MFNPPHQGKILLDALVDRYLSEVCSPIPGIVHNQFMASTSPQIPQRPKEANYPTPPPFLPHAFENKQVTSKKPQMTYRNKQLTSRSLPGSA